VNGQAQTIPPTADHLLAEATKLSATGDRVGAIAVLKTAMAMAPDNSVIANELGVAYYHLGDIPNAQAYFQKAVDIKPDFVRSLTNLGACFNERKDNASAVKCYVTALDLQPNMVDAWGNLAKAWTESEEFELAVYAYQKVISLNPKGEFYRGLAKAYRKSGRYDRSEHALKVAIEKNPEDHDAHFGMAYTCFHLEKYSEAIQEFEWRWKTKDLVKHKQDLYPIFNSPAYDGSQDLSDKTVLLHTEQGFGDNLQFARFIDMVRPKVKKLVMWTRPGLGKLFKHSFDIDEISENVFKLPTFDYHLPLLSIPYYFDTDLKTLSHFKPYLSAPVNAALNLDKAVSRLKIGLVWGASDTGFDHANKRVPLEYLRPLMETPGTQWYSLQVGSDRKDLQEGLKPFPLMDLGENLKNFADTASVVEQLDLVITVDTSVAHLAGAMGKNMWVMLKKNPDWRWHADGPETLWYPSARLYRQDSFGDWASVVRRVRRDLQRLMAEGSEPKPH
jgi:Flp pilus assembly protein TadD